VSLVDSHAAAQEFEDSSKKESSMPDDPKPSSKSDGPLESFLAAAESFVSKGFTAVAAAAGESEDRALLDTTAATLIQQFRALTGRTRSAYARLAAAGRGPVDEFLQLQQGTLLAVSAEKTALATLASAVGGGFFSWMFGHLKEIKKIIRMILELIFKPLPAWVDQVILIIDQLAELLLSLFGGALGLNRSKIAGELSRDEQNFWDELAALDKVSAVRRQLQSDLDD
jgi:hypothetical protein